MPEKHVDDGAAALAAVLQRQNDIIAQQTEMIAALKGSQPPRVVAFGDPDYQAQLAKERKAFKTPVFQNGFEADPSGLSDETIDRVSKLKAGRYINGNVEVIVNARGAVWFSYKNKTPDQRFARLLEFSSFTDLVNKIWDEMHKPQPVPAA